MFGVNINARGRGRMGRGGGRGGRGGRGGGDRGNGLDENLITRVEENDVDTELIDEENEENEEDIGMDIASGGTSGGGGFLESDFSLPPPPPPSRLSSTADVPIDGISLDFRDNTLPGCLEIVGEDGAHFEVQRDGSTALKLNPGSYLRVNCDLKPLGGKLVNDYTLTLDVLFDSLPSDSASIFQTSTDPLKLTEGETFVYAGGGIGVFGEVGVPEAALKEKKWTRIVVTVGPATVTAHAQQRVQQPQRARNRRQFHFGGVSGDLADDGNGLDEEDEEEYYQERSYSAPTSERVMTTYVNSKKCAVISSTRRGLIGNIDGRFAINPHTFILFGSKLQSAMPGCLVRYAELRRGALSEEQVRLEAQRNRIYSTWENDRQQELKRLRANLVLSVMFKKPPPVWAHPSIMAEFGDAYLEGSGLEGGDLSSAVSIFSLIMERIILHEGHGLLTHFSHDTMQSVNYVAEILKTATNLFRRYNLVLENGGGAQLIHFMKRFKKALEALREGEAMLVPGGIGQSLVNYIVEREGEDVYRFSIVNTDPEAGGLDYHPSTAENAPKIKFQTVLVVRDITHAKIMDDAFWGLLFKLSAVPAKQNTPDKLYSLLVPFLVNKPMEQIVAESDADDFTDWRSPQRASIAASRCMTETVHYLLRRKGVSVEHSRQFFFAIRTQVIKFIEHDLSFVSKLRDNDKKIVALACQQLAYLSAKLGEEELLSVQQLTSSLDLAQGLMARCEAVPCEDADLSAFPPPLSLVDLPEASSRAGYAQVDKKKDQVLLPFLDRLIREDDVNGLAGAPIVLPKYVPIDYFLIPRVARTLEDAVAAIRFCDRLCTLISVQGHCVKNRAHHKIALIEHVLTHVVPMPKPENAVDVELCIWRTPMRYGLQLDLVICLGRIMEHFISATFSMHTTKAKDGLNLVLTACITALTDVILRKAATDQPSEFCLHLMGEGDVGINQPSKLGRGMGYGLSLGAFAIQSETVRLYTPELNIARTAVLDYFEAQQSLTKIFNWDEGHRFEQSVAQFLASICGDLAFPVDDKSFVGYMTNRSQLINKNYPEFHVYRDIAFFLKYVQNVDPRAFPPKAAFNQMSVELKWQFQEGAFIIEAFMQGFSLKCYAEEPFKGALHRYPSTANPTHLASPHEIKTEDDVLHIKNLPSFKDCLGQQDTELLLSYLTVPYLRVPLVLSLFATEDRIHSLRSEELQEVLDAVLFEPSTYLPPHLQAVPTEVPCPNRSLLATSFGLLLNELYRSPEVVMNSVLVLAKLAVNLDVGTIHSTTVPIILYVLRLVARVDSFVTFLIRNCEDREDSIFSTLRDITVLPEILHVLKSKREDIVRCVRDKVCGMLEAWCEQLSLESINKGDDEVVDTNARISCQLHAHLLLLHRNVALEDYNFDVASTISSSFLYLTSRHTWNLDLLGIPENEIFEMLMTQRRNLINWTRSQPQRVLTELMEAAVRVTVGTGIRRVLEIAEHAAMNAPQWAFIGGDRSIGRFTVVAARAHDISDGTGVPVINPNLEMGIEVDLQTAQLTLKSSHLQALETAIAQDPDVQMIFGKKSMQASIVESSENRMWVHLVGRDHDVHFWRTPDQRTAVVDLDRDYAPGEVEECEQWIVPILEPVRMTYMTQPFVLQICMPEKPFPADAEVAMLVGIHPKLGGTWKEIFVFRSLGMVQVYQVMSYGRRFYRVLEYTSDVRCTLRDMQPSLDDRRQLWPVWERHGAGHPYQDHWGNPLSCVITRGSEYRQNLSGGTETLVPERLLYGTVPQTLLDQYIFWQDEDDNLRGYPRDEKSPYVIEITLSEQRKVGCTLLNGVSGKTRRVLRKHREARLQSIVTLVEHLGGSIVSTSSAVSKSADEAQNSWKFGFSMVKRIGSIVDSGVSLQDLMDFVSCLKESGAVYADANILVEEIEAFAAENGNGLVNDFGSEKLDSSLEQADLTLINLAFSRPNSKFFSVLRCLTRLENAGYILCWTLTQNLTGREVSEDINIDLIELPRLKMSFHEHSDEHGVNRLYSLDHVDLFVSNTRSALSAKLMIGMPHSLLMSTTNGELQILVPGVDPVRPRIGTSPFSTELVLNRSMNPDWYGAVDSTYFLFPVHVSLSFLFSPTLSSSLYLLLLRFLSRSYDEVFKLASTIGTDVEFSPEEDIIFKCIGRLNGDSHPDAHACRLRIALVTFDSPVQCPFDLTRQMSRYITKLAHVSAVCRITLPEELMLLETCVCDQSDPRFFDPETGKPRYSLYEVTVVKNRKYYLRALLDGVDMSECFVVPREIGSSWPLERNISAVMMDESSLLSLEVSYSAPPQSSANAVIDIAHKFWPGQEDMAGHACNLGFLYLYELMTGTKKAKILTQDNSFSLAVLLFELTSDKSQEALLPSILSMMARNPQLIPLFPKFRDNRQQKKVTISGVGDDVDPISPLGSLITEILAVIAQELADILVEFPDYDSHPRDPVPVCSVNKQPWISHSEQVNMAKRSNESSDPYEQILVRSRLFGNIRSASWIIPTISNFSCSRRILEEIPSQTSELSAAKEHLSRLELSLEDIERFSSTPLSSIGLDQYVCNVSREAAHLPPIEGVLPFNVDAHDQAKSAIAQSMLHRLKTDMAEYATTLNSDLSPKINLLLPIDANLSGGADAAVGTLEERAVAAIASLRGLISALEDLRAVDNLYVENALPWILNTANSVDDGGQLESKHSAPADAMDTDSEESALTSENNHKNKILFLLRRFSKQEVTFWLEFMFGTLLSSVQVYDMTLLNPFLSDDQINTLSAVMVAAIFHANRVGMINRCIADARDIDKALTKIANPALASKQPVHVAAALLKGESLARNLCTARHYIDGLEVSGGEKKRRRIDNVYDPRFLLFEFTWNILLRKSQVEMVRDYIRALADGTGMVKQMIMGAGKTTVVCPLLTLMLGDGAHLIVQVVPPALLDFSRSVMRSTFSSIMHKRIYTLSFDRSSEIDPSILKKLVNAKFSRGVVISTPTTVKSIMLKFLELLKMITDSGTKRSPVMERDAAELGRTLELFRESILIMDEVDLILHPMKSELNFPIGEKRELDFSPQRWQMPIHLLDGVFYAERKRMSVGFKQSTRAKLILERLNSVIQDGYSCRALQRNPHIVLLNLDWYKDYLQPVMADWLYMWLEAQHLAGMTEHRLKTYLLEGANATHNADLALEIQSTLSPNHKKMLNLGRDWLHSYLPHVLQKIDRVSFGIMNAEDYERALKNDPRMPRTRAKLAIPFVGKDVPSRSSEFAHPDVIIGLTILAYRYEGLRWTDFEDIMNNLRSTLTKELGPWSKRKSNLRYVRWVKEAGGYIFGEEDDSSGGTDSDNEEEEELDEESMVVDRAPAPRPLLRSKSGTDVENVVVSLRLLKRSNEEQMKKLFNLLRTLPDAIHFYLENFIFPVYTDNKVVKLSAAGQELGGEMLFRKRIGFSGTPSDLLPIELGRCGYERCSDGQMIHVLTSPDVCSYEVVSEGWSPLSLLTSIAQSEAPRYHALIDTGALITGMTNLQVAQSLLKLGLTWCEGVVFLDEYDRKMVLVRATGRVLKMAQCGVPAEKRFAFYDQVHTTGMDISHVLDAKAILTISKDMVFRDIAQGAYRMRGINKGQTIHILIIPEVKDLIQRELARGRRQSSAAVAISHWENHTSWQAMQQVLRDISAWLVINSMRSERVQFNQLCLQNVSNVYRKGAFSHLLAGHTLLRVGEDYDRMAQSAGPKRLLDSLEVFSEPIDFSLEECVPDVIQFSESIRRRVEQHASFVSADDQKVIDNVVSWITTGTNKTGEAFEGIMSPGAINEFLSDEQDRLLGAEMVQEQEQEREQEQEQEQEQEIEIEKYVDLAYSREHEEPTPWSFASLRTSLNQPLPQFYSASEFKLYKRNPLKFPDFCMVSNNYFDCRWSGARRIKNVVMVLDWIPELSELIPSFRSIEPLTEAQSEALDVALDLFDIDGQGALTQQQLQQVLRSALHLNLNDEEGLALLTSCIAWDSEHPSLDSSASSSSTAQLVKSSSPRASLGAVRHILLTGKYSTVQAGRKFVAISLAEAETIRCIMHRRIGSSLIPDANTGIALRCVPTGFSIVDASNLYVEAGASTASGDGLGYHFMTDAALESLRFLNCDLFFSERSLNILLRALHGTSKRERKTFFKNIISCRRRLAKKWTESSVAKVFTLADQFGQLKQRAQSVRLREAIQSRGMLLYDAFSKFNYSKNGFLTPAEIWGTFHYLGVHLTALDILDFVTAADMDRDGNVSYRELVDILSDPDKQGIDVEDTFTSSSSAASMSKAHSISIERSSSTSPSIDLSSGEIAPSAPIPLRRQASLTPVQPRGEAELKELQQQLLRQEEDEERVELESESLEEKRIRDELEAEADERDRTQEGGRNPKIGFDFASFDFSTGRMPRRISTRGDCNYRTDSSVQTYFKVFAQATVMVANNFKDGNCGGRRLNQYSITMNIMLEPPAPAAPGASGAISGGGVLGGAGSGGLGKSLFNRSAFPPAFSAMEDQTWGDFERSGFAGGASSAESDLKYPLFSTAAYSELDALVWLSAQGRLTVTNGDTSKTGASSFRPSTTVSTNTWTFLTLVVDCVEGEVEVFLNGRGVGKLQLSKSENHLDGVWSLGEQFTLFGTKNPELCGNGAIRSLFVQNRVLLASEVTDLVQELKRDTQSGVVGEVVRQLMSMGFTHEVALWAANSAEGPTIADRVTAALSFLS